MTEKTKLHLQLIKDIVSCYIDNPEQLKLTATEVMKDGKAAPVSVYWRIQGIGSDHGKLAGRKGVNVIALKFVVMELGHARDSNYNFELIDPTTPAPERRTDTAPPILEVYDCEPMRALLHRLVKELSEDPFTVDVGGVVPTKDVLTYRLTVSFDDANDHDYFFEELLDQVNTLFRAMHRKQGALMEVACAMNPNSSAAK